MSAPASVTPVSCTLAGVLFFLGLGSSWYLAGSADFGPRQAFQVLAGLALGVVLQRSRFCFQCHLRDLLAPADGRRDSTGTVALLVALALGLLGTSIVLGAWIVDPSRGHLPPIAHIGPVGWHLLVGGATFGLGMALSGSCISAHLYRLGEGALVTLPALFGVVLGFGLGFASWNWFYVSGIVVAPVWWLPALAGGYGLAVLIQLGVLAALAWWLLGWRRAPEAAPSSDGRTAVLTAVFVRRWPAWVGGAAVAVIGTVTLLRGDALGVTAGIGALARQLSDVAGLLPVRLEGLDGFRGCRSATGEGLLSTNLFFVSALVLGSASAALTAGQFAWRVPPWREAVLALIGGILLGFGAMISLGCTIGVLFSGIAASAVSGWVFAVAMLVGLWLGLLLRYGRGQWKDPLRAPGIES